MSRASQLRRSTLTTEERDEPTKLLVVRVPQSWHRLLARHQINVSDLLLPAVTTRIRELCRRR